MSGDQWEISEKQHKALVITQLESFSEDAVLESYRHRANAVAGIALAGLTAVATGVEQYLTKRWGTPQDMTASAFCISLGYAAYENHLKKLENKKALRFWNEAAHLMIRD